MAGFYICDNCAERLDEDRVWSGDNHWKPRQTKIEVIAGKRFEVELSAEKCGNWVKVLRQVD